MTTFLVRRLALIVPTLFFVTKFKNQPEDASAG